MRNALRYISSAEGTNQVKLHPRGLIIIIIIIIFIIMRAGSGRTNDQHSLT